MTDEKEQPEKAEQPHSENLGDSPPRGGISLRDILGALGVAFALAVVILVISPKLETPPPAPSPTLSVKGQGVETALKAVSHRYQQNRTSGRSEVESLTQATTMGIPGVTVSTRLVDNSYLVVASSDGYCATWNVPLNTPTEWVQPDISPEPGLPSSSGCSVRKQTEIETPAVKVSESIPSR